MRISRRLSLPMHGVAALALAAAGQISAVIFLAAIVVLLAGLSFWTRYVSAG